MQLAIVGVSMMTKKKAGIFYCWKLSRGRATGDRCFGAVAPRCFPTARRRPQEKQKAGVSGASSCWLLLPRSLAALRGPPRPRAARFRRRARAPRRLVGAPRCTRRGETSFEGELVLNLSHLTSPRNVVEELAGCGNRTGELHPQMRGSGTPSASAGEMDSGAPGPSVPRAHPQTGTGQYCMPIPARLFADYILPETPVRSYSQNETRKNGCHPSAPRAAPRLTRKLMCISCFSSRSLSPW